MELSACLVNPEKKDQFSPVFLLKKYREKPKNSKAILILTPKAEELIAVPENTLFNLNRLTGMNTNNEQTKKLNCLFALSRLIEKNDSPLEEIFSGIIDIIPPAWQYPEITSARLCLADHEYKTGNFQKTLWRLESSIVVYGEQKGVLEVNYLQKKPTSDDGPFLKEEISLLHAISERLGRVLERKRTENELQENKKRLLTLFDNSLTGISLIQDNQVIYQNSEQEKFFGPLPREYTFSDFSGIHPDDIKKVRRFTQQVHSGTAESMDIDFRLFPVNQKKSSTEMKWLYCRALTTEYHGKAAILFNLMDVTRIKKLEHIVNIQDKMSSLGRVASGIAHEIRNPLSGINIYLNTLEKIFHKEGSAATAAKIFGQLKNASCKIESIIKRVMDFSKPAQPSVVLIDVNHPVEEAINLSAVTLRKSGITVEKALTPELPNCYADANMLEEVVLNFITNAAEAIRGTKKKIIRIVSAIDNTNIIIQVSDSGPGVPENIRKNIFDPFYTTKKSGSGIGLSICHRIITDHGGFVEVGTSDLGGAEFSIKIPLKRTTDLK